MQKVTKLPTEMAVNVFGSVWLAEDMGRRISQHLGTTKPVLHFGDAFETREAAVASRGGDYAVVSLAETVSLPNITPVPQPRIGDEKSSIPHEVYIFAFDDLLAKGLRVVPAQINRVEFDFPPNHLMGKADFAACAVVAGKANEFRVTFEYDRDYGLRIVDNPQVWTERGYSESRQHMAFFREEDARREADEFAATLVAASDWRSRSAVAA